MRKCIGILGGGQLARMSAFEAYKLGFDIAILEKVKNSPAGQLTHNEFVGWIDDTKLLKKFSDCSDIITLENEFIDFHYLELIEKWGKQVIPSSKTICTIQDKLLQKTTLQKNCIPVPAFYEVKNANDFHKLRGELGDKFILKSRKMGYDGYGNALVNNEIDFRLNYERLSKRHSFLMAEKYIVFQKELAIMVARNKAQIKVYPVVETIQKNHICHVVIAPAKIPNKIKRDIEEIAIESIKAVKGYGLYGIEFFLTSNDEILVNEMAPRPHNSGHYTIEACVTSQFENHIRAIQNLPLGSTEMLKPIAVMVNLLGKRKSGTKLFDYKNSLSNEYLHLHIYGKDESRLGRKMGHITILGNDRNELIQKALQIESTIVI
jgi:5-(carboxyamino)imidazole ribonucleotide synthase